MKRNRPNMTGHYWYMHSKLKEPMIIYYDNDSELVERILDIKTFEDLQVDEWLGKVITPERVEYLERRIDKLEYALEFGKEYTY